MEIEDMIRLELQRFQATGICGGDLKTAGYKEHDGKRFLIKTMGDYSVIYERTIIDGMPTYRRYTTPNFTQQQPI